jgi:cytochrome c-type biogenesis protein CcmH
MRPALSSIKSHLASAVAAVALVLITPSGALAQCPQTSLADIEDEVTCPVCGVPLELATEAPQAQRERAFIIERIERCQSKEEIKAALVAQFGEGVLATPDGEGFDLAAYLVPVLAALAGLATLGFAAFRWRRRRPSAAPAAASGPEPPSKEDSDRVDRDLERYDL